MMMMMMMMIIIIKKALRETQTLRAGCSKAEPKNFAPPQTPAGWPKFNHGDGHYLYLQKGKKKVKLAHLI